MQNGVEVQSGTEARVRRSWSWRRRAGVFALALGALAPLGCQSTSEQWSFCVTREAYQDGGLFQGFTESSIVDSTTSECAAMALLAFMALPVAIDLVILPVTGIHDVCQRH